jgi:hypothetical protein
MHAGSSKGAAIKLTIAVALSCLFLRFLSTRGRAEHPPQAAVLSVDKGVPAHRTLPLVIEEQSPEQFWNEADPQVLNYSLPAAQDRAVACINRFPQAYTHHVSLVLL